jgi:CheY-like chemotaxis protein
MFTSGIGKADAGELILVVDDSRDNCFLLQVLLETEGYQVETASSGFVALDKIKATPPDLVLLDVMMPHMNGFEVTRQIRQTPALAHIPILLVTAYDQQNAVEGLLIGANGLVRKPIEFDELLNQIQSILSQQGQPTAIASDRCENSKLRRS